MNANENSSARKYAIFMETWHKQLSEPSLAGLERFLDELYLEGEKLNKLKLDMWEVMAVHSLKQIKAQWPVLSSDVELILASMDEMTSNDGQPLKGKDLYMRIYRCVVAGAEFKSRFGNVSRRNDSGKRKSKGKHNRNGGSGPKQCFRCNSTAHLGSDCPYLNATCRYCSKRGHLRRACRKKKCKD